MVLSGGPGHESLGSCIKQHQFGGMEGWGGGKQFQYNVPRALFPSLRTWCDSEGSQVPSCRTGRAQPPPRVVGNNDVPIQAGFASGLHFPKDFWRQVGRQAGKQAGRQAGPVLEGRCPPQFHRQVFPWSVMAYHIPVRWPVPQTHLCSKPGQGQRTKTEGWAGEGLLQKHNISDHSSVSAVLFCPQCNPKPHRKLQSANLCTK